MEMLILLICVSSCQYVCLWNLVWGFISLYLCYPTHLNTFCFLSHGFVDISWSCMAVVVSAARKVI